MSISALKKSDRIFLQAGQTGLNIEPQGIKEANGLQRLFGYATTITINGQVYSVNTNSLKKFLIRISTNDTNLKKIASKGALETDQNKKIRDTAFNALMNTAKKNQKDFNELLKNRLLQVHRSSLPSSNFQIANLKLQDALDPEKWNGIFDKTIETAKSTSLDLNANLATNPLDLVNIRQLGALNDIEYVEKEILFNQLKDAVTAFHKSELKGAFATPHNIAISIEKCKSLPLKELKQNVEIALKLAAIVQSEKKCETLKLQKKDLEKSIEDTLVSIRTTNEKIAQLQTLTAHAEIILNKLSSKTLITDDELSHFIHMPQLHAQLTGYNHSINQINRLNQEIQSLDADEHLGYLRALTQSDQELTQLQEQIEQSHKQINALQGQLNLNLHRYETDTTLEQKRIETINQHLSLLEQLLLSTPSSSKLEQLAINAKRVKKSLTLLSSEEIERCKQKLTDENQKLTLALNNDRASPYFSQSTQESIEKNNQTIIYYNLFGQKKALTDEISKLKEESANLLSKILHTEKVIKNKANIERSQLKDQINDLHQTIRTKEAAFWQIIESDDTSTTKKKAQKAWSNIKGAFTKKADSSKSALVNTSQFLAQLHQEMQSCQEDIRKLNAQKEKNIQETQHQQEILQQKVNESQTDLNLNVTLSHLKSHIQTLELAHHQNKEQLFLLSQELRLAEREATDIYLTHIGNQESWATVEEAAKINTYYLLSTASNDNFKEQVKEELKKSDFTCYNNSLLLVGAKEWLIA